MKNFWLCAAVCAVGGCSITSSGPVTGWGKPGVSMSEYRLDGAQCAITAAQSNVQRNGANSAGGINGQNGQGRVSSGADSAIAGGANTAPAGGAPTVGGSGVYRDSAPTDMVQRAATQQRAREMEEARVRNEMLRGCLVERGYTEFELTAEQRQQLSKLPQGSDERREYLYKLGTDPAIVRKAPPPKS